MKKLFVRLDTITKVKEFVNIVTKQSLDLDLISGRYVIDAKSIMGIFSLDLTKDIELHIHYEDENELNNLLDSISDYVVK